LKARVKKDTCIGCGACTVIASNFFQIGDDGLAEAINPIDSNEKIGEVSEDEKENVIDASESCPTGAIEVIENEEHE
jgi:ferredoxin